MIIATNKHTGEIVELAVETFADLISAWRIAQEYEKVSKSLKDQLKMVVPDYLNDQGRSDEYNGYMFKESVVQRKNYDKAVLRQTLDEDTYDEMLVPNKTALDRYLQELVKRGDPDHITSVLRNAMIETGEPYRVLKLEKLTRETE